MLKNKVWVSWSSGKDSAYALHKLRQMNEYQVVGLLTTITEEYDRVSMHGVRCKLLEEQAKRVGLPLHIVAIPADCTYEIYESQMENLLQEAINQDVKHIAFGDLFLEDIRTYRETKMAAMNITPIFPLWGYSTKWLAQDMIKAGMKAILSCIDSRKLDSSFAGRQFNEALLFDLPMNVDHCAENGEFHTFVYDGPMFSSPIPISLGEKVQRDEFIFCDISLG